MEEGLNIKVKRKIKNMGVAIMGDVGVLTERKEGRGWN